jgi:hypothetical protein
MREIKAPVYYELYCVTCSKALKSVLATCPGELLYPNYDEAEEVSIHLTESIRSFREKHSGHELEEREFV